MSINETYESGSKINCDARIDPHNLTTMMDRHVATAFVQDPLALSRLITASYHNVPLAEVNDHEIRMSVMTEQFGWHQHPDSDETFLSVDGELVIEFADREVVLKPGQFFTVRAGTLHRTRPLGKRSVNLTFERVGAATVFAE